MPNSQPLHPQLATLQNRYLELVQKVTDGELNPDDALGTLNQLAVFDGQRARWSIDEQGQFTRQRDPNSPPEPTTPTLFAPARTPQPAGQPQDPHTNPALATPRTVGPPPGSPAARPAGSLVDAPPARLVEQEGLVEAGPVEASAPKKRKKASAVGLPASIRDLPAPIRRLSSMLANNRLTAGVVAVCVVLILAAVLTSPDRQQDTPEVISPPTTAAEPNGGGDGSATSNTTAPDAASGTLPTPTTAPLSATPTGDRAQELASILTSGNSDLAAVGVENSGSSAEVLFEVARYAGLEQVGLKVDTTSPPVEAGEGAASQRWKVTSSDGTHVADLDVSWVRIDSGTWRLDGWPTLVEDTP